LPMRRGRRKLLSYASHRRQTATPAHPLDAHGASGIVAVWAKNPHRGSRRSLATASRSTRSQASIASEKNRLLPTTMHRMPVLAQSQDSTQSQNGVMPSGDCNPVCPEITVTIGGSSSPMNSQGPLLAQGGGPIIDPVMEALTRFNRLPTPLEQQLSRPKYTPQTGFPPPLPPASPGEAPWYILLMQALGEWVERGSMYSTAPPQVCVAPYFCQA
jgi:hypothetical protein